LTEGAFSQQTGPLLMNNENEVNTDEGIIDRYIQEKLGEKLKDAYSEVLNEPVPDRFVELLNRLSASLPGSPDGATPEDSDRIDGIC
jgi:pantoate kinase